MSYSMKDGKLEKDMPADEGLHEIRFHVIASMRVRVKAASGEFVDMQVDRSRITTHADDNVSKDDMRILMGNADALIEGAGVMLVEQAEQKKKPLIKPGGPAVGRIE